MKHPLAAFVPYAVISVLHLVFILTGNQTLTDIAATARMPLLALAVVIVLKGASRSLAGVLLLIAIVMSWFGGLSGSFAPAGLSLPLMLLFFGLAHLAYIWLYGKALAARRIPAWALVYVVWLVAILVVLWPHLGRLAIAVAIYGVVLAGTAIASTRVNGLVAWGGAFFLASDTFLSLVIFTPDAVAGWGFFLAMLTYNGGQGLLALGAVLAMRARR